MKKNKREKGAIANRQRGGAAEVRRLAGEETRRPGKCEEESGRPGVLTDEETRRQRKDAAPGTEMRRAELYGRWRAAVSRRQLAAPAPLLSIIHLARALFPTAGAFSLCSLPRSLQWHSSSPTRPSRPRAHSPTHPRNFYSLRTIFQPLYRVLAPFAHSCRESKRVNK